MRAHHIVVVAATAAVPLALAVPAYSSVAPVASSTFAGYDVVHTGKVTATKVTFVVPTITCKKSFSGVGPADILGTSKSFSGAGVGVVCEHGKPLYQSVVIVNGTETNGFTLTPKDKVTVTVTMSKKKTTVSIKDATSSAHKKVSGKGGKGNYVEIGCQGIAFGSTSVGVDPFTKTVFTDGSVNGHTLTKEHAYAVERVNGKTVQIVPSALSHKKDFHVTFTHS
jgi:hypothetical protein